MSAPAAKAFSLPVITIAPMAGFESKSFKDALSSLINPSQRAFKAFGLLKVTSATLSRISVYINW